MRFAYNLVPFAFGLVPFDDGLVPFAHDLAPFAYGLVSFVHGLVQVFQRHWSFEQLIDRSYGIEFGWGMGLGPVLSGLPFVETPAQITGIFDNFFSLSEDTMYYIIPQ